MVGERTGSTMSGTIRARPGRNANARATPAARGGCANTGYSTFRSAGVGRPGAAHNGVPGQKRTCGTRAGLKPPPVTATPSLDVIRLAVGLSRSTLFQFVTESRVFFVGAMSIID